MHSTVSFLEQIPYLNKGDLLVAFSLPPYSIETIEAAKYAKSKKIKVISITNKNAAPISFHSDCNLIVSVKNTLYTNSFAAVSVIINAIATECAFIENKKAKEMLNEINKIVELQNAVINN
jgi:DNA-binding MurR/RpiR family transcriptional regulator